MVTTASVAESSPAAFDSIYAQAHGDPARVPWDRGRPSPALVNWLNVVAPSLVRCGARVAVVGCGLGHDARELMRRGYDVTAFDCSHTAVEWAREIDPDCGSCFCEADLFDPPSRWRHRFDLVVEVATLQSLHPERRGEAVGTIADLLSPHGRLLVICRASERPVPEEAGPPWPLTETELIEATATASLRPDGPVSCFLDEEGGASVLRIRAVFKKS